MELEHKERRASKACKGPKLAYKSGRDEESVEHRIALHDVSSLAHAFGLGRKVQCEVYRHNSGAWDKEFLGPKLQAVLDLDEMVVSLAAVSVENGISAAVVSVESEIFAAFEEIDHAFIEEKESLACAEEIASSALARQTLVHKIVWKAS